MGEIPADLAETGLQVWIEALRDGTPDAGLVIIAHALLAERERCASIATQPHLADPKRPRWSQGKAIAEAIMEGAKR